MIRRLSRRAPNWYDEASAFVDGELAPDREAAFSRQLASSAQLRYYVDELHGTKAALAALPEVEVPRPFTISVEQAQPSPTMTRLPIVKRTGPRMGGLLEGTLLMRGAATFSAIAIAALAAVVVVDVTEDNGDSRIFRDFAAVGQVARGQDGAHEQPTVSAPATEQPEQAQAQTTHPPEEQAEPESAQAAPEPTSAEAKSETDAASETQGQAPLESDDTEGQAMRDQAIKQPADDEGDPARTAAIRSNDSIPEDHTTDAQTPIDPEMEAKAATETTESMPPPLKKSPSSGQAEQADPARPAESGKGAETNVEPTPENSISTKVTDQATDGATPGAATAAPTGTSEKSTDTATAATTQPTTTDTAINDIENPTSESGSKIEEPDAGRTTNPTEATQSKAPGSEPEHPAAAAARRNDGSNVVQMLEIVLGIAAGASILTLLVTLYGRRP